MSDETQYTIATALILAGLVMLLFCSAVACAPVPAKVEPHICPQTASVFYERRADAAERENRALERECIPRAAVRPCKPIRGSVAHYLEIGPK